jgi:hypothetical protein
MKIIDTCSAVVYASSTAKLIRSSSLTFKTFQAITNILLGLNMSNKQGGISFNISDLSYAKAYVFDSTLLKVAGYVWDRVPNSNEIVYTTIPNAVIQTILSPIPNRFDTSHPTVLVVFRDIIKLPSLYVTSHAGIEIGGTGVKHDPNGFVGSLYKVVCKVGILSGGGIAGLKPGAMSSLAIGSNFACEPLARFYKITSREYQINCKNCSLSYSEFMQKHLSDITTRTVIESASKTFTSDMIAGYTFKPLFGASERYIDDWANYVLGGACNMLVSIPGVNFGKARGPYDKANICIKAGGVPGYVLKGKIYSSFLFIESPAKILQEVVKTSIFVPVVSAVSDGPIADWLFGSTTASVSTLIGFGMASDLHASSYENADRISILQCLMAGIVTKAIVGVSMSTAVSAFDVAKSIANNLYGPVIELAGTGVDKEASQDEL